MEEDDGFLCCSICSLKFNEEERIPKVISCGHTLCLECLRSLQTKTCPECNQQFSKPKCKNNQEVIRCLRLWTEQRATANEAKGANRSSAVLPSLKGPLPISQLANQNKRASVVTTQMCEFCEDSIATLYCHQCAKIKCFCSICFNLKHQKAPSANHIGVPVQDLVLCISHSQVCDLFCTQNGCGLPAVCSECACDLRLHGGHTTCSFSERVEDARKQIEDALRPLETSVDNAHSKAARIDKELEALNGVSLLSGDKVPQIGNIAEEIAGGVAGGTLQIAAADIFKHGDIIRTKLAAEYELLLTEISNREKMLLAKIKDTGQQKRVALEEQLDKLRLCIGYQTSLIHRVKQELLLPRGDQIAQNVTHFLSEMSESESKLQLEVTKELASTSEISFHPTECGESLLQQASCYTFGMIRSSNILHFSQNDS